MDRPKHSNIFDWLCVCVLEQVWVSIIGLRVHHAQNVVSIQLADSYYTFFFHTDDINSFWLLEMRYKLSS